MMAHRVNVTPVQEKFALSEKELTESVQDVVCGKELVRHDARFMVFRGEDTFYFCSKECQEKFVHPTKKMHFAA